MKYMILGLVFLATSVQAAGDRVNCEDHSNKIIEMALHRINQVVVLKLSDYVIKQRLVDFYAKNNEDITINDIFISDATMKPVSNSFFIYEKQVKVTSTQSREFQVKAGVRIGDIRNNSEPIYDHFGDYKGEICRIAIQQEYDFYNNKTKQFDLAFQLVNASTERVVIHSLSVIKKDEFDHAIDLVVK